MGDAGVFPPNRRLEPIIGEILETALIGCNPEYWALNPCDNCEEANRQPHDDLYAEKTLRIGDTVHFFQCPEIAIRMDNIL